MKRIIALVLAIIILSFSFLLYNFRTKDHVFNPSNDVLTTNDDYRFQTLRKSVFQVTAGNESGTAFIIDIDTKNETLYFMTNLHVVDGRAYSEQKVTLVPTNDNFSTLKGTVIYTGGEIDMAIIKVTSVSSIGMYTTVPLNKNSDLLSNAKNEYFYTVGYPALLYRQDKFRYTGMLEESRFTIDNIVWAYSHFNFNYHTLPGSSGSPIVNYKGELFALLSTNMGGVGYTSIIEGVNDMCTNLQLTIEICR